MHFSARNLGDACSDFEYRPGSDANLGMPVLTPLLVAARLRDLVSPRTAPVRPPIVVKSMAEDVLRILHVSPYVIPDPTLGGVPQSVRSTCQELSQAGHDVTVWGSDTGNPAGNVGRRADPNPQPQLFRARFKALSTVLNTPVV